MIENEIIINHPNYGYVKFTKMTPRQIEILEDYIKIKKELEKLKEANG